MPTVASGGTQSCGTGATPDANKDRHRYWGNAFALPGSVTSIDGIQVQATLKLNNNGGTSNVCAQLSWDGGATWTTIKSQDVSGGNSLTTYTFGSTSDTWGHSPWTLTQLNTTNFRVRLIDASTMANKDFSLDFVSVQVTSTPYSAGMRPTTPVHLSGCPPRAPEPPPTCSSRAWRLRAATGSSRYRAKRRWTSWTRSAAPIGSAM